ncbi:hypothetical protein FRB90_005055 [Tulasnella sp. 427]|nr:hypothetical protein FRB90_005055 [Tulasnella sp. 427]
MWLHYLDTAGGGGEEDSCIDNSSGNIGRQRRPEPQGCASRHFTSGQRDGQETTSDVGAISTNASGEAVDSSTTKNQSDPSSDCTGRRWPHTEVVAVRRLAAQRLAQSLLYLTIYDNVKMSNKVAEQVLGRKDNPINGTCASIVKLHNASEESLLSSSVDEAFQSAKPLTFEDIDFTESERLVWDKFMLNTFLRIATTYGGTPLERFHKDVEADTPVSHSKIALHKSEIHPLPALEIDESSITGNIEVLEAITEELGPHATSPDFMRHVRLFAGDQLSVSRLRSIAGYRAGHEGGFQSFKWPITIPGLFYLQMAATQGVLETFFGKPNSSHRNPGSLHSHNLVLDRKLIVLTSLPPVRITRDLIFHSLYARVLGCLLQFSNHSTLKDLNDNMESYESLRLIAQKTLDTYANTRKVAEMRNQWKISKLNPSSPPAGDMVLESAMLFLRNALALRAFTDAIKSGDSGFVLLSLKNLAFAFQANGRTKYAHEILFVLHDLTYVWPPKLRQLAREHHWPGKCMD